jgi:RNA polymerase sigma-70 factor, ECF subfamily
LPIAGQEVLNTVVQASLGTSPAESSARGDEHVTALTRKMAAADEAAYRAFYERYFERLSRYLLVVARGDEEAAREALQGALVRVARHIRVFADEAAFWSWLTVLARSALSDQSRKQRRYLAFLERFTRRAPEPALPDEPGSEEKLLALLDSVLAALPWEERDLLQRKYIGRQSVADIATAIQTSEKAVESRLVRLRRKLKAALLEQLKNERSRE